MAIDNKYTATDRLCDLIDDNFKLLMVMSRFGISLGFGEKSVKEVCEAENVDCDTFLAVANFIRTHLLFPYMSFTSLISTSLFTMA